MAERKCGNCRQPGHTRATCIREYDPQPSAPTRDMDAVIVEQHAERRPMSAPGPTEIAMSAELLAAALFGSAPAPVKGRWHGAHRAGLCTWCGDGYAEGDRIRSDGSGGWECEAGFEDTPAVMENKIMDQTAEALRGLNGYLTRSVKEAWERPTTSQLDQSYSTDHADIIAEQSWEQSWERPTAANVQMPPAEAAADPWSAPAPVVDAFSGPAPVAGDEDDRIVKTERLGYICTEPTTGEYRRYKTTGEKKGITRVTTFVKAASNSVAITEWNKRNVAIGASRRPDLAAQAHGMDVNRDRAKLDRIVAELEDAAGGNVASQMGTDVHAWTERVDAGECTVDDVPPTYRRHVRMYVDALAAAGFRVVKDLRERTTYIEEFGGVAGTFDAILHHLPSDSYVLSDTKSGKNVGKYGFVEIETQEWIYAHGYNRFGCYNWEAGQWEEPQFQVRMDYGLVIHLPFEGDHAGTCRLLRTDLQRGAAHAKLCHDVRSGDKGKAVAWELPEQTWDLRFLGVQTTAEAGRLWELARADGVEPMELKRLVGLAQDALRSQ